MELNDVYDKDRNLTGRKHRRGTAWHRGEYGLVVCVWIYDGNGKLLLTRRAPGKSFAGTWENSGGAAKAGKHENRRGLGTENPFAQANHPRARLLDRLRLRNGKAAFASYNY